MMTKQDYWYWKGYLSIFDNLPDGAWWACCEDAIGGYDKLMEFLKAGRKYDKEVQK